MEDKTCLITGGSRGIGKAIALELARKGAEVIIVSKDRRRLEQACASIVLETGNHRVAAFAADLSILNETRQLSARIKAHYPILDILINNHTAIFEHRTLSRDGIEMNFALNYLAYFHLTLLLLDLLKKSPDARVINVAAEAHREVRFKLDDPFFKDDYDPLKAYCQAKLYNIVFTYELTRRMWANSITVSCLHPGSVDTDTRQIANALWVKRDNLKPSDIPQSITPEESAKMLLYLATSPDLEGMSGRYFIDFKDVASSRETYDLHRAAQLWELSSEIVGIG